MSENEQNQRANAALQRELEELNTPQARLQAQIDRLWWTKREAEVEEARIRRQLDPFNYGHWR